MIRGLYTSAMGMIVQEKRQANVSQNLANVETTSFKKQELIARAFDEVGVKNKRGNSQNSRLQPIGSLHLGVQIDDLYTDFQQGIPQETNKNLDFAIEGEGFFTIQLPSGNIAYTRDGSFRINEAGQLSTKQGYLVLGRNPYSGNLSPIELTTEDIQVDRTGMITLPNGQNHQLNIVSFGDAQSLQRLGENLYLAEGQQPTLSTEYTLSQGFIERSNINPLEEMVKMIEITRSFESNQKVIQSIDETLGKAVNEVGRLG